jgi:hypothetical protein
VLESFGFWLGIISGIVTIAGFLLQYRTSMKTFKDRFGNKIIAALLVSSFLLSTMAIYISSRRQSVGIVHFPSTDMEHLKYVHGKHYVKEEVKLDGVHFDECTFDDVTLTYEGTDTGAFSRCRFNNIRIKTDSDPVSTTISLLKIMGIIKEGVPTFDKDEKQINSIPGSEKIH